MLQVALRSGMAGLAVMVLMLIRQRKIPFSAQTLRPGLLVGLLFSVEFMFVAEGLRFTTAAHMAVFLYTAPIFAALGLHFLVPEERLSRLQWSGVGITFLGVIVAFLFGGNNSTAPQNLDDERVGGINKAYAWSKSFSDRRGGTDSRYWP